MSTFHRRQIAALVLATLGLAAATGASAQEWSPTKPVRIIVPITGSTNDVLARLIRQHLADFVEPQVPTGGMQMPCLFIRDIPDGTYEFTDYIDGRLLPRLRPHALSLVDAFLLSPELVRTNLASDEASRRATIANLVRS